MNLAVHEVPQSKWKEMLERCFSSDPELIQRWHIESGTNVETCVNRTLTDLLSSPNLKIYSIEADNEFAGYFGKETLEEYRFMTGFFIMPRFRNRVFIGKFWKIARTIFKGHSFIIGIYTKNERARKFLLKEGELIYQDENITTVVIQ